MSTTQTDRVLGGRYQLGELLGRGGMADVYDAVDTRLGRPVAVKILRPAMAARPDVRRRFEDEARAAASLSHPNVVAVFDTGEDAGEPWIVMERLSGDTLAHRIAEADGPLPADWVLRMAGDVLGALSAAHAAGIMHRDVKPGNILFNDEGCAKVADFGIAKSVEAVGDATTAGMLLGTPRYLAPERVEGQPTTIASDLYAVGVILWESLTGRKAFDGDSAVATAYNVQHTPPPSLAVVRPDLPPEVAAFVDKAMARDPADRFATASEMGAALAAINVIDLRDAPTVVGADPTIAVPRDATTAMPAPVPAMAKERRPVPWLVIAVGVAILLLLAGLALAGGSTSKQDGPSGAAASHPNESPLTAEMRQVASRIDDPGHDGPAGPQAAAGLRSIADKLDAGQQAGSDATALAQQVNSWHSQRQLFDTATKITLDVLAKVPGFDAAAATPATAPAAPAHRPKGHKKKGDD